MKHNKMREKEQLHLVNDSSFRVLLLFTLIAAILQFTLVFYNVDKEINHGGESYYDTYANQNDEGAKDNGLLDIPPGATFFPPLPALAVIENNVKNPEEYVKGTMDGTNATIIGIGIILQRFLLEFYKSDKELASKASEPKDIVESYYNLAKEYLLPFDEVYRGKSIFPIRDDGSIFISIAAFRDHLLGETLKNAFSNAKHPNKIYVGAIVQNCFGFDYTCQTGVQVIGKKDNGQPITKISDTTPDVNGIYEFCTDSLYEKYCTAGHIRVLYVNETESAGPSFARYFASKLWAGETYYIQVDAHLQFANEWDQKYISELQATKSYPLSILSSYPPGFDPNIKSAGGFVSPGTRNCRCSFANNPGEHSIIKIAGGVPYSRIESASNPPTQIPYIAAGFFMTRAEFLIDVPFDPLVPWTFMGEEIALSIRAWTSGWDIYAPRINYIAHQYRPGRLGLPKFWESISRTYTHTNNNGIHGKLEKITIERFKYIIQYPQTTRETVTEQHGTDVIFTDVEHYNLGTKRTHEEYLNFTGINLETETCGSADWCNNGEVY